jgi:MFS superfamily sulfate permease-like transporter
MGLRRYLPLVPGSLVAVALGVLVVMLFNLDQKGVEVVGTITPGLPHVGLPSGLGLDQYLGLVGPAVGVVLVGFAEGLGAARRMRPARATTSTPTRSCSASAPPTPAPVSRPAWSSTAACRRPR